MIAVEEDTRQQATKNKKLRCVALGHLVNNVPSSPSSRVCEIRPEKGDDQSVEKLAENDPKNSECSLSPPECYLGQDV